MRRTKWRKMKESDKKAGVVRVLLGNMNPTVCFTELHFLTKAAYS